MHAARARVGFSLLEVIVWLVLLGVFFETAGAAWRSVVERGGSALEESAGVIQAVTIARDLRRRSALARTPANTLDPPLLRVDRLAGATHGVLGPLPSPRSDERAGVLEWDTDPLGSTALACAPPSPADESRAEDGASAAHSCLARDIRFELDPMEFGAAIPLVWVAIELPPRANQGRGCVWIPCGEEVDAADVESVWWIPEENHPGVPRKAQVQARFGNSVLVESPPPGWRGESCLAGIRERGLGARLGSGNATPVRVDF